MGVKLHLNKQLRPQLSSVYNSFLCCHFWARDWAEAEHSQQGKPPREGLQTSPQAQTILLIIFHFVLASSIYFNQSNKSHFWMFQVVMVVVLRKTNDIWLENEEKLNKWIPTNAINGSRFSYRIWSIFYISIKIIGNIFYSQRKILFAFFNVYFVFRYFIFRNTFCILFLSIYMFVCQIVF